jgi:hypothetical protein
MRITETSVLTVFGWLQDAFLFAAVLALFYVLVNAWQQLAALH